MPADDDARWRALAARTKALFWADGSPNELNDLEYLDLIVKVLNSTPEPDVELIGWVGAGQLENFVRDRGDKLWPHIERLARADRRFRRALRAVWAYDSPEFDRRDALLEELGEFRTTWVRFVVYPDDMTADSPLSWRAIEMEGSVSRSQLAPLLRSIADWCERD